MSAPVRIAWHGPEQDRTSSFKVIVTNGRIAQHHVRLTEAEYVALLAAPSMSRPNVAPAIAKGAALAAELLS